LTGEAGTGKTTLIQAAMSSKRCKHVSSVYLHNPALTRAEFFEMLARQFGLDAALAKSKTSLLAALETALLNGRARGQAVALVVDEAQCLSHELLEEIRLLANFEVESQRLIPLVLAGQPELGDRLNEPNLRQLKQRIALRCTVEPFTLPETAAYMSTRIKFAGGEGARLFTREAVILVHERSRGIARTINVICDNALLTGMALGRRPVGFDVVMEVCEDFDLCRPGDGLGTGRIGPRARREEIDSVEPAGDRGNAAVRLNAVTPSI
jgi:type II secretory pathway predicted ATPase ExeA